MNKILVTYDLCKPGADYKSLYDRIQAYPRWAKLTESSWLINTDSFCENVRDNLLTVMDKNDRLFVGALTGEAAWYKTLSEHVKERL